MSGSSEGVKTIFEEAREGRPQRKGLANSGHRHLLYQQHQYVRWRTQEAKPRGGLLSTVAPEHSDEIVIATT